VLDNGARSVKTPVETHQPEAFVNFFLASPGSNVLYVTQRRTTHNCR
jgi:hypothetical protein